MELERETGWQLHPIGGDTGQAYMGIKNEEKLFLKRNSSPFLAALSVEGITPRLMWTKRIGNGDVLTAQEWCNGRSLTSQEMASPNVAKMLSKIHHSQTLKRMLVRVGGKTFFPDELLRSYQENLNNQLQQHPLLEEAARYLEDSIFVVDEENMSVCHGDVYRKNWLLSDNQKLYLVDWDSAILADPALDLGMLLGRYVPKEEWGNWISSYGAEWTEQLSQRVKWYAVSTLLMDIKRCHQETRYHKMNHKLILLEKVLTDK
ncbi:phosphotransferase family protein [Atopococcus tabaci]|uniref:phosphotransferase family protein n=1 Tax=Atopococcus tabaci TaxID=269774 RepID=UPI000483BD76|nr:phosphotransferase family protein [Atopococcus tabaci]